MFLDYLKDAGNYEDRKISKVESKKRKSIGVSTAYTSDEGYETALLDSNGVHPVERYPTKKVAEKGHAKWIEFATTANGQQIKKLGWSGLDMDEIIILKA